MIADPALHWRFVRVVVIAVATVVALGGAAAGDTTAPDERADVVELVRTAPVFKRPVYDKDLTRGRLLEESRVQVLDRRRGPGCTGQWLRIDDDAWICSRHTQVSTDSPAAEVLPRLDGDAIVPHTYVLTQDAPVYPSLADAVAGTNEGVAPGLGGFRVRDVKRRRGQRFIKISEGWVRYRDVRYAEPSTFNGLALTAADRDARIAFVRSRRDAAIYDARGIRIADAAPLPRQSVVRDVGAPVRVGRTVLTPIGDDRYVLDRDLARVTFASPPDEVAGETERWLDVDLDEQTMVAYEGDSPVFATMVSTARTVTPEGVFHIYKKRAVSFMKSKPEHRDKYNLDTPWVMTINGRIAMHAVYWHDDFGTARSHGCVNMSPQDAKFVWDWTHPQVPPGWLRVDAPHRADGTVVRIRR